MSEIERRLNVERLNPIEKRRLYLALLAMGEYKIDKMSLATIVRDDSNNYEGVREVFNPKSDKPFYGKFLLLENEGKCYVRGLRDRTGSEKMEKIAILLGEVSRTEETEAFDEIYDEFNSELRGISDENLYILGGGFVACDSREIRFFGASEEHGKYDGSTVRDIAEDYARAHGLEKITLE